MKNRFIAALLAIFLGGFGVHKFYLGKWNGIFYLLLCWTYIPVIIAFIEGVLYLVNGEEAFDKKYNKVQIPQENTDNNCSVHIPKEGNLSDTGTSLFKVCPKCGQRNEPDSNFCEFCGKKL